MNEDKPILTLGDALNEIERLKHLVKRRERDNRLLSIMNDNTERLRGAHEAEKKLQYLYNDLLLKNCPNMIFLFNEELRLVICSVACERLLLDNSREDLRNMPLARIFPASLDRAWVQKILEQSGEALEERRSFQYDDTIFFANDTYMHAQVQVAPILDAKDVCRGTILTLTDVTELIETKQRAEEAAKSKSSFLANMSHEIRTPMNAIKGLSELISLTELNAVQRNYINNIISSANSLINIINDVLDFSKIDANKISFVIAPYSLAEMLAEASNVISLRAQDKALKLLIEASPNMPARLLGDDVRIKQVITNLLSNAVKYTREGYVRVSFRTEIRGSRLFLVCMVEDSGIGIREEDIPRLFDAFSRVDLHTNRSITGTGLGLAISRQLALAMGGDIEVQSVYGQGSTFTFFAPQDAAGDVPLAEVEGAQGKRVLLIGDRLRMQSVAAMLAEMDVACHITDGGGLDVGPRGGRNYTHCIYDEEYGVKNEQVLRRLRASMPACLYAVLKDMHNALNISDLHDVILFSPLLVTKLAEFANRSAQSPADEPAQAAVFGEDFTLQDARLLVVDDNEINLMVSSEMLRVFEADVTCVNSGEGAVKLCADEKFDLIFLDQMMPGMDGIQVAQHLRGHEGPNRNTPIVALTANVVNDMRSHYIRCGMDDFIGKPTEFSDLARILTTWLPPEKIRLAAGAAMAEPLPVEKKKEEAQAAKKRELMDLVETMDIFGLYASDVVRELDGNVVAYFARFAPAGRSLPGLVERLKRQFQAQDWAAFGPNAEDLSELLHSVGARDCAARARKMAHAAKLGEPGYILEDFLSLMGNMYMLEKKLIALAPHAKEGGSVAPVNETTYLCEKLAAMHPCLEREDKAAALALLDEIAAYSLDMNLDMGLKAIKAAMEANDFKAAQQEHVRITKAFHAQRGV